MSVMYERKSRLIKELGAGLFTIQSSSKLTRTSDLLVTSSSDAISSHPRPLSHSPTQSTVRLKGNYKNHADYPEIPPESILACHSPSSPRVEEEVVVRLWGGRCFSRRVSRVALIFRWMSWSSSVEIVAFDFVMGLRL
jgi:hypothetical protein